MNSFALILKQMRQRSLSSWLTLLSVVLGVTLACSILILQREGERLLGQKDFGYDILVGPKSGQTDLVLYMTYGIGDKAPGTIPWSVYTDLTTETASLVRWAVPVLVGDTYKGQRIVGTTGAMFGVSEMNLALRDNQSFEYRPGEKLKFAQGCSFDPRTFEGVIGSEAARKSNLKLGDQFWLEHSGKADDIHDERWKVVGILEPTHTALDGWLFIPMTSSFAIPEHEEALGQIENLQKPAEDHEHDHADGTPHAETESPQEHAAHGEHHHEHEEAYTLDAFGHIQLKVPPEAWRVSAILVRTRGGGGFQGSQLQFRINNRDQAMALNPASVMRQFFDVVFKNASLVLLVVAVLVVIVAAVSILVSIYNSVAARRREIAILRALGATRGRVLTLICAEAALIGFTGAVLGLLIAHSGVAIGSLWLAEKLGEPMNAWTISRHELFFALGVVALSALAGLVPALKAYGTPIAQNLVAE